MFKKYIRGNVAQRQKHFIIFFDGSVFTSIPLQLVSLS